MNTPISRARERVIERLARITVVTGAKIEDRTEIYHGLRLSGDDLWGFLDWVHTEFETDFSAMDVSNYAPGEGAELFSREYRSLTVGAVLEAIAQGMWLADRVRD